jgi:mRNA-degrading endonuclease RelE of RelBE toxin-antitoxin system
MPYDIILSPQAIKDLKNLPADETDRILSTLEQLRDKPASSVNRLQGVSIYSLHIDEYTILLDIIPRKLLILEIRVEHRRKNPVNTDK